jgi:hypothetical protein
MSEGAALSDFAVHVQRTHSMLREHILWWEYKSYVERTHPMSSFAVHVERTHPFYVEREQILCWETLSTWENMISLSILKEHVLNLKDALNLREHDFAAKNVKRTCWENTSYVVFRCQYWKNMFSIRETLSILREHDFAANVARTCWENTSYVDGQLLSDVAIEELSWILENRFPSLCLPPSLPYRAGVVGGKNNVDIYTHTQIYIIYRRGRRGEQCGDLCVDSRQRSQGTLLRRSRPSSHCLQNQGKHSPKYSLGTRYVHIRNKSALVPPKPRHIEKYAKHYILRSTLYSDFAEYT